MKNRQIIWIMIVLVVGGVLWYTQRPRPVLERAAQTGGKTIEETHYSPGENLEQLDVAQIDSAQKSLDIAMYAFTDRFIADAVLRAARRGVVVRIYRDHSQFDDEQRKAGQHDSEATSDMFKGERNIEIRVKHSRELMHLKAYCVDGALLRDGSANWSPSGLKRQDNDARLTNEAGQAAEFERVFSEMWSRDNDIVQ